MQSTAIAVSALFFRSRAFFARPLVHRFFVALFLVSATMFMGTMLTGCASPAWLTDAGSIIPVVLEGATTLLAFIATVFPQVGIPAAVAAAIVTWGTNIEKGIQDIEALIEQYKANPGDTLLQDIQSAAALVITNLQKDFSDIGVPAAIASKIQAFAQLILTQLTAWTSLLPTLATDVRAGQKLTLTVPFTNKQFKQQFNAILDEPTGDEKIDAVLAKLKRLR